MHGLMMEGSLSITSIMQHAVANFPRQEIVSVTGDNPLHRYTYADAFARVGKLANALARFDLAPSDRIATLAWNDYRHLEIYYATACAGYVCHTINPRLFAEQITFIINHANDQVIFVDPMFVPLLEAMRGQLGGVKAFVVLTDKAGMAENSLPNAISYEALIDDQPEQYSWPDVDERDACALCYTSGTTGDPKGVLFSHRASVLHAMSGVMMDVMGLDSRAVVLAIVPMFHVNAWGMPYSVPMTGGKLVLPGPKMGDGETLQQLIEAEGVTYSAGVPTVWLALADYLEKSGKRVPSLTRACSGGAALPQSLAERFDRLGVRLEHGWGMTEMSPIGTYNIPTSEMENLSAAEQGELRLKQGRAVYGVQMRICDDTGLELPRDGEAFGHLQVRGLFICSGYLGLDESDAHGADGWFDTGDVATIDAFGLMQITDRTKDVIKSGGEWISSIQLENAAIGHPAVAEAAVIGVPHPKWTERPLLIVVPQPGESPTKEDLLHFLADKVAKWWIPDDVVLVAEIPHTATGKISKKLLREQFADFSY